MKDFVYKTEIITTHHCEDNGEIVSVDRVVSVNGEVRYQDTMSPEVYLGLDDRLADLDKWLNGIFESDTDNIKDIIEARREIIKQGRISFLTLLNLRLKILKAKFKLLLVKFKHFLLESIAS